MKLKLNIVNGESIAIICPFGNNRPSDTIEWNKKVMVDYLELQMNYIYCPFPAGSHGYYLNAIVNGTIDKEDAPDYYLFIENDSIFLNKRGLSFIYDIVKNKQTVWGLAWQSNHKSGPRGVTHAYAGPAGLCVSRQLYNELGRPDLDHHIARSDTAEELTYRAKELGFTVALTYISEMHEQNTPLDNSCFSGLGNVHGKKMFYHASQQGNDKSATLFIEKCREVISGKFE